MSPRWDELNSDGAENAAKSIISRVEKLRKLGHGSDVANFQDASGVGVRG
jgi:hypothetical protein